MRIAVTLAAALRARAGEGVSYRDGNEPGRSGWHEIVLRGVEGVELSSSTAPLQDMSDELRRYPADPTMAPPDMDRAAATIGIASAAAAAAPAPPAATTARLGLDAGVESITAYLRRGVAGDPVALALAFAVAVTLGAVHALTPGHGKTIMAAFLIGTNGGRSRALVLGLAVAASHTLGVIVLAAVILGASTAFAPERLYPVLSALSALTVVAIGAWLLRASVRERAHSREHAHGHEHDGLHAQGEGRAGWRALIALGVSGGLVPSASALIILLAALAVRRPDLGLLLVAAFGAGMAAVLVALGLALVGVRNVATHRRALAPIALRFRAYVPLVTAIVVLATGVVLSAQAAAQLVPL
jgi:ABC-type nickel/cobalt efflux system permease component RcnA